MIENEYDLTFVKRQLELVKDMLLVYLQSRKSFGHLVSDLDGLISAIVEYEKDLSDNLRIEWWDLEQINAALLDELNPKNDIEEDKKDIEKCSAAIIRIVEEYLYKSEQN